MAKRAKKPPRRRCKGAAKSGKRCRAAALTNADYCSAHDPKRPDKDRFGSRLQAARAGASSKPRVLALRERLLEEVEARLGEILAVYTAALAASTEEGGPDHGRRLQAARELLDRTIGKPHVTAEVEVGGGQTWHIDRLSDPELAALQKLVAKLTDDG
jgi:hypothetical protein